jgi:endonuclease YncB( thermonuclease family)
MPRTLPSLLLLAALLAASACGNGRLPGEQARPEYQGRVIRVLDGDTLDLELPDRSRLRVRLAGIDAPERGQPFSKVATDQLSQWVLEREVRVSWVDQQPARGRAPGRVIGDVWLGERLLNRELVEQGLAWAYDAFLRDPSLCAVEQRAREERRGLWRAPQAQWIPPWVHRARAAGRPDDWVAICPRADLDR